MSQEDFEEMAKELLSFIENPDARFESKEHQDAYRLQRTRIFLEMKFGYVEALQKQVDVLRRTEEAWEPVRMAWSKMQKSPDENQF